MGSNGQICLNTTNQTTEYKTVFISGIDALVKLPLLQRQLARIQGLCPQRRGREDPAS